MTSLKERELREEFDNWLKDYEGGATFPDIASWWLSKLEQERQTAIAEERERAVEIIHKYAMQTTSTAELDRMEAAQREILTPINTPQQPIE